MIRSEASGSRGVHRSERPDALIYSPKPDCVFINKQTSESFGDFWTDGSDAPERATPWHGCASSSQGRVARQLALRRSRARPLPRGRRRSGVPRLVPVTRLSRERRRPCTRHQRHEQRWPYGMRQQSSFQCRPEKWPSARLQGSTTWACNIRSKTLTSRMYETL